MSQKFVTFEIAKALKEAGYPQNLENAAYYNATGMLVKPNIYCGGKEIADAPTYIEVWLWLWQEKKIYIDINCIQCSEYNTDVSIWHDYGQYHYGGKFTDPVDAITSAINYLVENDLIK